MIRTAVIVLCLLLSAATAWAECAWVLWATNKSGFAVPVDAFKTKEECLLHTRDYSDSQHPRCLPDTIDPRASKR